MSCPPSALAPLKDTHRDGTSPCPRWLTPLQPGGSDRQRCPGGSAVPCAALPAEGNMDLNSLRCFLGVCAHSASSVVLLLLPCLGGTASFTSFALFFFPNKLCFLAITFQ